VAYEYIVPNNLLWAVVVPAVFLTWQTGSVPGPLNLEFWLIGWWVSAHAHDKEQHTPKIFAASRVTVHQQHTCQWTNKSLHCSCCRFGLYKKCWPNVMSAWLAVTGLA
jgi:hypothetical protein